MDYKAQIKEADDVTRSNTAEEGWVSHMEKFQATFEALRFGGELLLSTYEWGESREEVNLTLDDAKSLHAWLTKHIEEHV